jgi:tetratricopeptide (TPR) repeat protein
MRETLPVDPADAGAAPDPERESRIEELLLSGLDQYFAGRYEEAINLWTRVAFLERGHGRARAYIERARGAQAERQRESEELLQTGVAAYQAGDIDTARTLLTRAIEEGGPTDVALALLQRLNRVEAAAHAQAPPVRRSAAQRASVLLTQPANTSTRWLPTIVASAVLAIAIILSAFPIASWIAELPINTPAAEAPRPEPLPIVRTSDMLLSRAQALHAQGKPKDALAELDRIPRTDPARPEADRLLATVQRELLAPIVDGATVEQAPTTSAAQKGAGR